MKIKGATLVKMQRGLGVGFRTTDGWSLKLEGFFLLIERGDTRAAVPLTQIERLEYDGDDREKARR